jgi:hypothetical protein
MRPYAVSLFVLLCLPAGALELNPITGSVDGVDRSHAEPLIEKDFGPIIGASYYDGLFKVDGPTPVYIIQAEGRADKEVTFLFCNDKLSGFWGHVTQDQLRDIYRSYGPEPYAGVPMNVEYAVGEMRLYLPTEGAEVIFWELGGKSMQIEVIYPAEPWRRFDTDEYCSKID